jgi:hypothetical protein
MNEYRLDDNWKQFEGKKKYRQPDIAGLGSGPVADARAGCPGNALTNERDQNPAQTNGQALD